MVATMSLSGHPNLIRSLSGLGSRTIRFNGTCCPAPINGRSVGSGQWRVGGAHGQMRPVRAWPWVLTTWAVEGDVAVRSVKRADTLRSRASRTGSPEIATASRGNPGER